MAYQLGPIAITGSVITITGSISLSNGGIISDSGSTTTITPPGALPGQSLVIRPTAPNLTSNHPSGFYPGDTITITFTPSGGTVTGTGSYTFTGCTEVQLGTSLTGSLYYDNEVTQSLTWTVPALSDITGFTFDIYNFSTFATNSLSLSSSGSSEHSHVHLVSGDSATTDIYLGDDDQYIKIEKNAGNVVIGTNLDANQWIFDTSGSLTTPGSVSITGSLNVTGSVYVSGSLTAGATTSGSIDLSGGNFAIPSGGIYEITTATGNELEFPDATANNGQTIVVINITGDNATVSATNQPVDASSNGIASLNANRIYTFVSVNTKWYGGYLS